MDWIVKLQEHGGQYRITLPRELLKKAELENEELIRLETYNQGEILIERYYGKGKKERDISENRS